MQNYFRCRGEFGTPDLWHPRAKYPREIGIPKQDTLREFGTRYAALGEFGIPLRYS